MKNNKHIIILTNDTTGDARAALLFNNEADHKQVQVFIDDFQAENKEWQYSELIEAICAEFDAEELMLDTIYI